MKAYLNKSEAVIDMHTRGYCDDFELFGNHLLWIQQNIFIRENEFAFHECHYLLLKGEFQKEAILFGVISSKYDVKGILMNHYNSFAHGTPSVISKKISKFFRSLNEKDKNSKAYVFENN